MTELHAAVGVAVLASNLVAGAWGGIAWLRGVPSVIFWYLLRAAQATVIAQVLLGLALIVTGRPADDLHLLYGVLPLVVTLISEGMRVGAAQRELADVGDVEALERREQAAIARRVVLREMGIMSVGAILIVTLALRAAGTTGWL
ncbi:MAG: hypothetical protein M3N16_02910 [Actinomycetota bacterium]|nr:hypothetical protein [Actinomycetota bacterium]